MNEDEVLNNAIQWFTVLGSTLIYQTRPVADGAIGGVDAILHSTQQNRYTFIDAKGTPATAVALATGFTNSLGALVKRIRFEGGYFGNEDAVRFIPPNIRDTVRTNARHRVSDYVLAFTPEYERTVQLRLDPALASLLHIRVLIVAPGETREFNWPL